MPPIIGIDLGGTKIFGLLMNNDTEEIIATRRVETSRHGIDAVLEQVAKLCQLLCDDAKIALHDIHAVGIGLPGPIDYAEGRTILLPNVPGEWQQKPVEAILEKRLDRGVWIVNDARAFTLAEAQMGAGRGYRTVVAFTLGTGIGGGIAIDGQLFLGADGNAGEFGHMTVDVHGAPDGTNTPGAIEAYSSGPSIAAAANRVVMQGIDTRMRDLTGGDLNEMSPRTVLEAAMLGDPQALAILDTAGKYLGAAVANMITVLSPDCIVFGGGVASLGEAIFEPMKKYIAIYSNIVDNDSVKITVGKLGNDAGAIGAAVWAYQRQQIHNRLSVPGATGSADTIAYRVGGFIAPAPHEPSDETS